MNRKILGLLTALALAAGCEFAEKTKYEGPIAQCRTTGGACTENAECCSYGCEAGVCVPGNHAGTVCKTTDDCGTPDFSITQLLCKSGVCSVPAPYCRDDADVCAGAGDCCSHHCSAVGSGTCVPNKIPVITVNGAVQTVPRNQPWAMSLSATASDPDGATETASLAYGWTFSPAVALTPSNAVANPTFNPGSTVADYVVTLTVTDTWGASATASFTLHVVNSPPVVTPTATPLGTARNLVLPVAMTVSDANGDPLDCTWAICRHGTATCLAAPAGLTGLAGLPESTQTSNFPVGLDATTEGDWDVALTCSDGAFPTTGTTVVTVTNNPPTITTPPAASVFNLGFDGPSTPDATIAAGATDQNGDVIASWSWAVVSAPAGSGVTNASLTPTNVGVGTTISTSTIAFKPDVTGSYTLSVTACDPPASNGSYVSRPGDCTTANVVAHVYPYIRPLGTVVDAAWRKSDDRLIAATSAPSNQLWIVNPAVDPAVTADTAVALGAAPVVMSLASDGQSALLGQSGAYWQTVSLGVSPTASSLWTGPFVPTSVVHFTNSRGYAIGAGGSVVYDLNLSSGANAPVACALPAGGSCTLAGNRGVGDGTNLWILDDAGNTLSRFSVKGNGDLQRETQRTGLANATALWRSSDALRLYLAGGAGVLVGDSLADAGTLPVGLTHVDSSGTGASLVGLAATGGTIASFGSSYGAGTPIALPHWGDAGADRTLTAKYVFVSGNGTKAHVVVQSSAPAAYGLYSCTLPCTLP